MERNAQLFGDRIANAAIGSMLLQSNGATGDCNA